MEDQWVVEMEYNHINYTRSIMSSDGFTKIGELRISVLDYGDGSYSAVVSVDPGKRFEVDLGDSRMKDNLNRLLQKWAIKAEQAQLQQNLQPLNKRAMNVEEYQTKLARTSAAERNLYNSLNSLQRSIYEEDIVGARAKIDNLMRTWTFLMKGIKSGR